VTQTHTRFKRATLATAPRAPEATASSGTSGTIIVEWSGVLIASLTFLVAILTLGTAAVGFFGFSELRRARERAAATQKQMADRLREIEGLADRWENTIQEADTRLEAIVQGAYGFNQGQEAYAEGNYQRAVDCFRRASQLQPRNTAIQYKLGRSYTNIGELEKAENAFHKVLEIDPGCSEAYRGIAIASRYDDLAKALINAQLAVEVDATDLKNWNCLGLLLRDDNNNKDAIDAHKRAYRLDETQRITSFYLALLYADAKIATARDYMHEATADLDQDQHYGRIKPLWAAVLKWAHAVFNGNDEDAGRWAQEAASACQTLRRIHEVRGHMLYLLAALGRTDLEQLPDTLRNPVPHPHPGERYDLPKDAAGSLEGRSPTSGASHAEEWQV
jgi:tetratricopeptide (TPR) repeat protein